MLPYILVLLVLAAFGLSTTVPSSSAETDSGNCTLTYIATQPPQIGPTTTIYQQIMTIFQYAVDCDECAVTNIPTIDSQGPFTEKTTHSMLTITHINCMPTGRSSIRLHAQGKDAATATQTATLDNLKSYKSSNIFARSDQVWQATEAGMAELAASFANALPPDVAQLSGGLKDEFTNIASAMFALSLCDSGLNLTSACEGLGKPETKLELYQSWYNPDSIQSIVCFCASYGYDFDTSRQQLYASLYAALIGVLSAADLSTDRGQICDTLSLFNRTGPSLGIDIQQYHELVCSYIPSATPTTPIWYGPTPIVPYVTNNLTTWGTPTSWAANTTIFGTGSPNSWENNATLMGTGSPTSQAPNVTITGTGIPTSWAQNMTVLPGTGVDGWNTTGNGSTWGPPISWTGTIGSDWSITINTNTNWTQAQPTGIEPATAAASETGTAASNDTNMLHKPRGLNWVPHYPQITKKSTLEFKQY